MLPSHVGCCDDVDININAVSVVASAAAIPLVRLRFGVPRSRERGAICSGGIQAGYLAPLPRERARANQRAFVIKALETGTGTDAQRTYATRVRSNSHSPSQASLRVSTPPRGRDRASHPGTFMIKSRNAVKDFGGRGLVKKSARLFTVETKGTRMRCCSTSSRT